MPTNTISGMMGGPVYRNLKRRLIFSYCAVFAAGIAVGKFSYTNAVAWYDAVILWILAYCGWMLSYGVCRRLWMADRPHG